eukprot:Amastigsp_a176405_19.p3 type:complete len:154 gc:universal Amastigsp_a176405_19:959-498(-)
MQRRDHGARGEGVVGRRAERVLERRELVRAVDLEGVCRERQRQNVENEKLELDACHGARSAGRVDARDLLARNVVEQLRNALDDCTPEKRNREDVVADVGGVEREHTVGGHRVRSLGRKLRVLNDEESRAWSITWGGKHTHGLLGRRLGDDFV